MNCHRASYKQEKQTNMLDIRGQAPDSEVELRPSIGSLEIWLGSLENSPARTRSRSKCSKKILLDFCSDRKKIENICTFCVVKLKKYVVFILLFKINTKLFQLLEIFY